MDSALLTSPSKYVKSGEEVANIRKRLAAGRFIIDSLDIEFETTREFIRSVLPPCLEPGDAPTGIIGVSKQESEICGTFNCAVIFLSARCEDVEGLYSLLMLVDQELPITLGREMWGEAKKMGTADLLYDGRYMYGYADRKGTRLIEVEAELGPDLGPADTAFTSLELKAQLDSSGHGLQYDPILFALDVNASSTNVRKGPATVKLAGSKWDPIDSMPIISTGQATHSVGECYGRPGREFPQSDRDAYVPYILGRYYDDPTLFRVPQRHR